MKDFDRVVKKLKRFHSVEKPRVLPAAVEVQRFLLEIEEEEREEEVR